MSLNTSMSAMLILASIGGTGMSVSPAMAQSVPVPMVQCVNNVLGPSWIAANVKWYNAADVNFIKPSGRDNADTPDIDESVGQLKVGTATPVLAQTITAGQQSCMAGLKGVTPPRIAIISVAGAKFVKKAVDLAGTTLLAAGSLISCPATAGAGCAAALAIAGSLANGGIELATLGVPDAKEVFYIGFPSQLQVSGDAWNPVAKEKTDDYRALIDFCHRDLKDTATANNITVDFLSDKGSIAKQVIKGNVSDCGALSKGYLEATASSSPEQSLKSVRVSTDGGDAMLIDQVTVYRNGDKLFWDGRDNGGGWCLSTDRNDYQGGWESAATSCAPSYSFSNPAK